MAEAAEAERKTTGQNGPLSEEELARQLRREAAIFFPKRQNKEQPSAPLPPQQKLPQEKEEKAAVLQEGESAYEDRPSGSLTDDNAPIDRTEIGNAGQEIGNAGQEIKEMNAGSLDREDLARGFKLAAVLGKPRGIKAWEEDEF